MVTYENGDPAAIVGVIRDMTERKQAGDTLRRSEEMILVLNVYNPFQERASARKRRTRGVGPDQRLYFLNTTIPSGGMVINSECPRWWHGSAAASSPPKFPKPFPPYSPASLFNTSLQNPPSGTPIR